MNKKLFITLLTALAWSAPLPAGAAEQAPLYMVGDATDAGWDEWLPEELTPIGGDCYLWDGYLGAGRFKFLGSRGDWGSGIAPGADDVQMQTGQQMTISRLPYGNGAFSNSEAGWVRMVVDMGNMSVNFRRPALGLVGPAARGWSLGESVIPLFADDEGRVEWTGQLLGGELKILAEGCRDWSPCYNAPFAGDVLSAGGHAVVYNTSDYKDGEFVDFKYNVPAPGIYTLSFKGDGSSTGFYGVDVAVAEAPSLDGAFTGTAGRYLVAFDSEARRVHAAPVPDRLYIGTSGDACTEIAPDNHGSFSSVVTLKKGEYYKLSSDPSDWDACSLSPNADTDITAASTANVAPMHGYSYTVPEDGEYLVTADFNGAAPSLGATRHTLSAISAENHIGARPEISDGTLYLNGHYMSAAVYDPSGRMVAASIPCRLAAGVYIVRVDNNVFKISVK